MIQSDGDIPPTDDGDSDAGGSASGAEPEDTTDLYGVNTTQLQDALGDLDAYYSQDISWSECGGGLECAAIYVPVDYDNPEGRSIALAVKRLPSESGSVPSLLLNPGGPGGSGVEMVENAGFYFSTELTEGMNLVGWDPRGTNASAPVHCYNTEQLRELYDIEYDLDTDEGWEAYEADAAAFGQACAENTDEQLEFVGTPNTIKDMDIIRAVLGEDELNFFGFSYGTKLGALYAQEFPETVGRFVLDGAMDLSLSSTELLRGQIQGFDTAYRSYLEDCLTSSDCPFTGTVDEAMAETITLIEDIAANPVGTSDDDRDTDDSDLVQAILVALYSVETWDMLSSALSELIHKDDGTIISLFADIARDLDEDGNYPYDQAAISIINCLDYPATLTRDEMNTFYEEAVGISELWGSQLGGGIDVMCQNMPFEAKSTPEAPTATGAGPIVVIGTERDPATPRVWADAMAEQLEEGVLLTWDGDGHTAYPYSSCISEAVDTYFLEGALPQDGLTC